MNEWFDLGGKVEGIYNFEVFIMLPRLNLTRQFEKKVGKKLASNPHSIPTWEKHFLEIHALVFSVLLLLAVWNQKRLSFNRVPRSKHKTLHRREHKVEYQYALIGRSPQVIGRWKGSQFVCTFSSRSKNGMRNEANALPCLRARNVARLGVIARSSPRMYQGLGTWQSK